MTSELADSTNRVLLIEDPERALKELEQLFNSNKTEFVANPKLFAVYLEVKRTTLLFGKHLDEALIAAEELLAAISSGKAELSSIAVVTIDYFRIRSGRGAALDTICNALADFNVWKKLSTDIWGKWFVDRILELYPKLETNQYVLELKANLLNNGNWVD